MNSIQQISLKIQMGIDPLSSIKPELLRALWTEVSTGSFGPVWRSKGEADNPPPKQRKVQTHNTD